MKYWISFSLILSVLLCSGCWIKIKYYMKRFETTNEQTIDATAAFIAREFGKEAVPQLIAGLQDLNSGVKVGSAKTLALLKTEDPTVPKKLVARLRDDNPWVAATCADALVELTNDKEYISDLEACRDHINFSHKQQVMKALERYKRKLRGLK